MKGVSEDLVRELLSAEAVLDKLARKLEAQFAERFEMSGVHNPMSILKRVQRIQGELPELRAGCQQLIERKQELIDVARHQLLQNRQRLQALSARAGCQPPDDEEVHEGFTEAMAEWGRHVAGHRGAGGSGAVQYRRDELNKALADSMLTR